MKILAYDIESVSGRHNDGSMCSFGYCKSDDTFAILENSVITLYDIDGNILNKYEVN